LTTRRTAIDLAKSAAAEDVRATRRPLERIGARVARTVRAVMGARHSEVEDVGPASREGQLGTVDHATDVDAIEGPPEKMAAARRKELIRTLLDALPEEQAEVLVVRITIGWSLKDIATTSGAPFNTVRSRLRLAKETLRRRIADDPVLLDGLRLSERETRL
jgi:hypothetical protein